MADSLQTRAIDLPSDSTFAVAMRTQQQAEREEQQRIKNLVLNYDLTDDQQDGEEPSFHYVHNPNSKRVHLVGKGTLNQSLPTRNRRGGQFSHKPAANTDSPYQHFNNVDDKRRTSSDSGYSSPPFLPQASTHSPANNVNQTILHADGTKGSFESPPQIQPARVDKSGNTRSKQRSRKLQLGDIDWYGRRPTPAPTMNQPASQISLDSYVVDKSRGHGNRRGPRDNNQRAASGGTQQGNS